MALTAARDDRLVVERTTALINVENFMLLLIKDKYKLEDKAESKLTVDLGIMELAGP